ncbi:MAG: MoaD/ThiS family protein [Candidatus Limivicinus sp.]|jgi:molybdopterin converting factor small subunit
MIKVRFFGPLRLDTGIKSLETGAGDIKELLRNAEAASKIPAGTLKYCNIFVNNRKIKSNEKLHDGDEVMLLMPFRRG